MIESVENSCPLEIICPAMSVLSVTTSQSNIGEGLTVTLLLPVTFSSVTFIQPSLL